MKVTTYEATVENGLIKFSEPVRLPEHARVYVVVPGAERHLAYTQVAAPGGAGARGRLHAGGCRGISRCRPTMTIASPPRLQLQESSSGILIAERALRMFPC